MANQSQKQTKVSSNQNIKYYQTILVIVTFVYLVGNLWAGELFKVSTLLCFLFLTGVNYFCYRNIERSLVNGLKVETYSYYLDLFFLNTVVQFGSTVISEQFWYLYLILPGILVWYLIQYCWGKATQIEYEQTEQEIAAGQKGKGDQERVQYVRDQQQ